MNAGKAVSSSGSAFARIRNCARNSRPFTPTPLPVAEPLGETDGTPMYVSLPEFSRRTGLPGDFLQELVKIGRLSHFSAAGEIHINYKKGTQQLEALECGPKTKS